MTDPASENGQITDSVSQSLESVPAQETGPLRKSVEGMANVHPDERAAAEADRGGVPTPGAEADEAQAMIQEALAIQSEGEQQQTVQQDKEL